LRWLGSRQLSDNWQAGYSRLIQGQLAVAGSQRAAIAGWQGYGFDKYT